MTPIEYERIEEISEKLSSEIVNLIEYALCVEDEETANAIRRALMEKSPFIKGMTNGRKAFCGKKNSREVE